MENNQKVLLQVSDFLALTNQTLEYSFSNIAIEGEVSGFKVNQNKYVFFDLKDGTGSVGCFMTVWQLRQPIEDGMKVVVSGTPKVTDWGKFSLTVQTIAPSGEGSIKRSFDLLRKKLESEGLFHPERKRVLPAPPRKIAVISSTQAAGYADFIKILGDRWGGLEVLVGHVQVQGGEAPNQIIRALGYFNSLEELPEVIVIIRGGGSLDDLSAFNDELLVREIAKSRVPVLVGIGHETDETLSDLAADVSAATPSNAAQLLVPDKQETLRHMHYRVTSKGLQLIGEIDSAKSEIRARLRGALDIINRRHEGYMNELEYKKQILSELDPNKVLARGYALVRGEMRPGQTIEIETLKSMAKAEVIYAKNKS